MATLTVPIADVSTNALPGAAVLARLCDVSGRPLTGMVATGGIVVEPELVHADDAGIATFNLIPNADVQQDNTFYSIKVAHYPPVIILKTADSQTLLEAIAVSPAALGPAATLNSLGDVDTTGADIGDILRVDTDGEWKPYPLPAGSVTSYTHIQGVPATTWTINHNLSRHPVISVLDTTDREIIAEVTHVSVNQATVTLLTALTGTAECR